MKIHIIYIAVMVVVGLGMLHLLHIVNPIIYLTVGGIMGSTYGIYLEKYRAEENK